MKTPIRAGRHLAIWLVWQSTGITLVDAVTEFWRSGVPSASDRLAPGILKKKKKCNRRMPIYEYRCRNGHEFEVFQSMSDDPVEGLRGLQCARGAGLPPGGGALQGLGLLHHRLRPQDQGGAQGEGNKDSSDSKSDSKSSDKDKKPAATSSSSKDD